MLVAGQYTYRGRGVFKKGSAGLNHAPSPTTVIEKLIKIVF